MKYQQVKIHRKACGGCPTCGRLTERLFSESMAVDASRRNPDGSVKTRAQVQADIAATADGWVPDFEHAECRNARGGLTPEEARKLVAGLGDRPKAADIRRVLTAQVTPG